MTRWNPYRSADIVTPADRAWERLAKARERRRWHIKIRMARARRSARQQ